MSASYIELTPPEFRDSLSAKGLEIYETKLKSMLEPEHNDEYVAIHVDSEDYALGRGAVAASRALDELHPTDGRMVVMKVGPGPDTSFLARMLAAEEFGDRYARSKE